MTGTSYFYRKYVYVCVCVYSIYKLHIYTAYAQFYQITAELPQMAINLLRK